jgi:hypothetical protein
MNNSKNYNHEYYLKNKKRICERSMEWYREHKEDANYKTKNRHRQAIYMNNPENRERKRQRAREYYRKLKEVK